MTSGFTRRAGAAIATFAMSAALAAPAAGAQSISINLGVDTTAPCQSASPADMEQLISEVHEATNRERAAAGVGPVERLDSLDTIARDWSSQMADEQRMYHNPQIGTLIAETYPGQTSHWSENVLQNWCGASGDDLVDQWMGSLPHRINLLRPGHTHLGVGAAVADNSALYATQNFIRMR